MDRAEKAVIELANVKEIERICHIKTPEPVQINFMSARFLILFSLSIKLFGHSIARQNHNTLRLSSTYYNAMLLLKHTVMLSLFTEMFSHNQTAGAPNEMPKCTNQHTSIDSEQCEQRQNSQLQNKSNRKTKKYKKLDTGKK